VYQAGTLSGNPLAMAAGCETLAILQEDPGIYQRLEDLSARLANGIASNIAELGIGVTQNRVGSMSTLFFTGQRVIDYPSAASADTTRYAAYFREMLQRGIYLPPSQFEAAFVSSAHTEEEIDRTVGANREALRSAFA